MKSRRYLLSFLSILLFLPAVARAQLWSGIIDSKRAIDWSKAGLPGSTLPDSNWPICATISAYSGTDAAITSALASCNTAHPTGGVVVLGAGTFTLSSGISFPHNPTGHLALRGQGANSTVIKVTGSDCGGGYICLSSNDSSYPQQGGAAHWTQVTSGQTKGSSQLILSSLNTAVVGSLLVLNQCDTGYVGHGLGAACTGSATDNGGYFHCQVAWSVTNVGCAVASEGGVNSWRAGSSEMEGVVITAINQGGCGATCVTLSKPIEQPDWGSDTQAVIIQVQPYVGVENLTLDASAITTNPNNVGIQLFNTWHGWVSGVAIVNMARLGVHLFTNWGGLVKDSYFFSGSSIHDAAGIRAVGGANNLIQNNICHHIDVCDFQADAVPEQADVFAYNFSTTSTNGITSNAIGSLQNHGAGSAFTLLEGNAVFGMQQDGDHGASDLFTLFRNFLWGWTSCANGQCGAGGHALSGIDNSPIRLFYGSRYDNIIGNVLGTPGFTVNYKTFGAFDNTSVYIWGAGQFVNGFNQPTDSLVGTTTMLWGNWDVANGATRFVSAEVPTSAPMYPNSVPASQTLPNSFYLSTKPSWFGSIPWPAIGPDVSNGNVGQCAGTFDVTGQFNGVAALSSSQCTGSTLSAAWAGHVNANPAMACYFSMGGLPDGTGGALTFNPSSCYGGTSVSQGPDAPTSLVLVVNTN
jgi:Pectate lyase superfamily protein